MATVSNVRLSVQRGGEGSRRTVRVDYTLCFNSCEALGQTVFVEDIDLRGSDLLFDHHQAHLARRCVRAQQGCVERSITRRVSRSTLDEDGDTVILGWVIDANQDELYARVRLEPFEPREAEARSGIVTGQWGAAGDD